MVVPFFLTVCLSSHEARRFLYGVYIEMVFLEAVHNYIPSDRDILHYFSVVLPIRCPNTFMCVGPIRGLQTPSLKNQNET